MDSRALGLYVAASLALIATPGQDMMYVVSRSLAQGRVAGLASAVGVCLGILVHTALAGSTNCGRNATKKSTILGLLTLESTPWRTSAGSEAGGSGAPSAWVRPGASSMRAPRYMR